MTTQEQIEEIIESRYHGYRGALMRNLKHIHGLIRNIRGDEVFLDFLIECRDKYPMPPEYEIPSKVKEYFQRTDQS